MTILRDLHNPDACINRHNPEARINMSRLARSFFIAGPPLGVM